MLRLSTLKNKLLKYQWILRDYRKKRKKLRMKPGAQIIVPVGTRTRSFNNIPWLFNFWYRNLRNLSKLNWKFNKFCSITTVKLKNSKCEAWLISSPAGVLWLKYVVHAVRPHGVYLGAFSLWLYNTARLSYKTPLNSWLHPLWCTNWHAWNCKMLDLSHPWTTSNHGSHWLFKSGSWSLVAARALDGASPLCGPLRVDWNTDPD